MNSIAQTLNNVHLGDALSHENLTVFPLFDERALNKDYLTLDEAFRMGVARVTEVSDSGSVPQLLFCNGGEQAVFLLDGEELVGAKQNRILNISILAPGQRDTVIPVSCVESGRWHHESDQFESTSRAHFSEARARKAERVSESMASMSVPQSDQSEVWADIEVKMGRMESHSESSAVEQVYKDHEATLNSFVEKLRPLPHQVGGVFAIRDRMVGLELFDTADAARTLIPKVIRSYALDAIDSGYRGFAASDMHSPGGLLERVALAGYSAHQAVGEGNDLRFDSSPGMVGGALEARERIVHLCVFVTVQRRRTGDDFLSSFRTRRRGFRDAA